VADISLSEEPDGTKARLSGDFDMDATFTVEPALERALAAPDLERLVIDLSGLEFIDSTGIGVLMRVTEEARAAGVDLAVLPGPREVQRVFAAAGVEDALPFRGAQGSPG
jgi:anti-anti-sigma factor